MKKSDQLKKTYDEIKAKINDLQEAGETKKSYDMLPELKNAEKAYKVQLEMEKADLADFLPKAAPVLKNAVEDKVMRNRIFNKLVLGAPLNEQEQEFYMVDSTPVKRVDDAAGTPGQVGATPSKGGYLVPEEQMAQLREYRKAYTSLKTLAHVQTANSTSGSMPTLGDETGLLTNFEEITTIKQSDFDFGQLKYEIKDYGDIIPVSNQLLQDGGAVLDFPDKAVPLDWVSNLHFPQQFQAAAVFIFSNREWDGHLSILRVLRVAQYGLHFVLPPVPPSRRTTDP